MQSRQVHRGGEGITLLLHIDDAVLSTCLLSSKFHYSPLGLLPGK